ncbi:MAG: peptidylprolyl isomerase [Cyanothece sp. SIO2G6]|nr:peptidylprolyl isomerase [Cyanothece sp. SIO2G6]
MANLWRRWLTSALHASPQRSRWQRFIQKWGELSIATLLVVIITSLGLSILTPTPTSASVPDDPAFARLPYMTGDATVELIVNGETITLAISGNEAPITAGNFVDLVDQGFYDGLSFHRVVREPRPFVAQSGDPQGRDPDFPEQMLGTGGYIDPRTGQERNIPLEILPRDAEGPLYNTTFQMAGLTSRPILSHKEGAVAMARAQPLDSASSQFYITLAAQPFLDGNYAVFGFVTDGMDAVQALDQGDRIESARVIVGIENLTRPGTTSAIDPTSDPAAAPAAPETSPEPTDTPAD